MTFFKKQLHAVFIGSFRISKEKYQNDFFNQQFYAIIIQALQNSM